MRPARGGATASWSVGSATVATALGLVSIAFVRFRFRGRTPLLALAVLPVVPFIVLGVAVLLFSFVDLPRSLLIGAGHVVMRCCSRPSSCCPASAGSTRRSKTRPWTSAPPIPPPCGA
jgi:hypothetical protein